MKTLLLTSILLLGSVLNAEIDLSWVDEQIKAILPKRVGTQDSYIAKLENPILLKKAEVAETPEETPVYDQNASAVAEKPLRLFAIVNNSALVNGQWIRSHDEIRGYTVERIASDHVLLNDGEEQLKLFMKNENPKIKLQVR